MPDQLGLFEPAPASPPRPAPPPAVSRPVQRESALPAPPRLNAAPVSKPVQGSARHLPIAATDAEGHFAIRCGTCDHWRRDTEASDLLRGYCASRTAPLYRHIRYSDISGIQCPHHEGGSHA